MTTLQTKCNLALHGSAGNSCPHSLKWVLCPRDAIYRDENNSRVCESSSTSAANHDDALEVLLYPSSGIINMAVSHSNNLMSVHRTLVTTSQPNSSTENKRILARGEAAEDAMAKRSITALDWVDAKVGSVRGTEVVNSPQCGIVAAYSDGTLTSWRYTTDWKEYVVIGNNNTEADSLSSIHHIHESVHNNSLRESIADVSAVLLNNIPSCWLIGTASSSGVTLCLSNAVTSSTTIDNNNNDDNHEVWIRQITSHSAASIQIIYTEYNNEFLIFVGSASPRHNKIWVYTLSMTRQHSDHASEVGTGESTQSNAALWANLSNLTVCEPCYQGCLLGHQDWITCFAWLDITAFISNDDSNNTTTDRREALLASSGHDAKIRLWKFTSFNSSNSAVDKQLTEDAGYDSNNVSSDEDEANIDDLEEGEARLLIHHSANTASTTYNTTAVSLEALLLGHEEAVTSLSWRGNHSSPQMTSSKQQQPCLLSSSMDRSILLWMEQDYEQKNITTGVWVPISRVGSAGGILGGSIGASLMGFVDSAFSPVKGRIVGHGYGGSLHLFSRVIEEEVDPAAEDDDNKDDVLLSARWLADSCITGHFRPVQDLAWDPLGEYLLTVGSDQTTRLWAEVSTSDGDDASSCRWMEVGRPQVHGYDMTSIACIGGDGDEKKEYEPRHRFVSGADEKVLRVFDAPLSTLRLLSSLKRSRDLLTEGNNVNDTWRIERAFLPSLGLSNKATADPEQESAKYAGPNDFVNTVESKTDQLKLPSERDLGVTTLWPETRKLFGHDSELVCLDAYRAAAGSKYPNLVASSCKARNDVASAAIRLWNVNLGKCVGVLKGGHRSTASTLSFSRDGKYLASSGKDRRICIWKRSSSSMDESPTYELSAAKDSAHKRIVWSVHFSPTHPEILATGSRDGFVKIWHLSETADYSETAMEEISSFEPTCKTGKTEPVTAVAFADSTLKVSDRDCAVLGIGTETGHIEVWAIPIFTTMNQKSKPTLLHSMPPNNSHFYTVNKIAWRPVVNGYREVSENDNRSLDLTLASCGEDCGVRIFTLTIKS